jgi:L,D-transpeptidase catalytic domain
MNRWARPIALATALLGAAAITVAGMQPAAAATPRSQVSAGTVLNPGAQLRSPNGSYHAVITARGGRFVVARRDGSWAWRSSRAAGAGAHVSISRSGSVYIRKGGRTYWSTSTTGSGKADVLRLGDDGVLSLTARGALVWSSRLGSGCGATHAKKSVLVDISEQLARVCQAHQQVRLSRVTTGASARGDGTPTGHWRVQAKVRNTVLHPAGGGAYHVHYWVPYNGAYGMHDSPWQKFAYGSARYRTKGSHGCVHFPGATMKWLFGWIRVGSTVRITR